MLESRLLALDCHYTETPDILVGIHFTGGRGVFVLVCKYWKALPVEDMPA